AEGESATEVIVVSGHDGFKYAQQATRLGAFDYLLKPVEPEEMHRCLDSWMREREIRQENGGDAPPSWEKTPPVEPVIRDVQDAMPGEITLKEAAEKVHLNACYLSQLFKQKTGENFVEYVTDLRMKEAEKLLSGTHLRIYEIADRLGF